MNKKIRVVRNGVEVENTDKGVKKVKLDRKIGRSAINKQLIKRQAELDEANKS